MYDPRKGRSQQTQTAPDNEKDFPFKKDSSFERETGKGKTFYSPRLGKKSFEFTPRLGRSFFSGELSQVCRDDIKLTMFFQYA